MDRPDAGAVEAMVVEVQIAMRAGGCRWNPDAMTRSTGVDGGLTEERREATRPVRLPPSARHFLVVLDSTISVYSKYIISRQIEKPGNR